MSNLLGVPRRDHISPFALIRRDLAVQDYRGVPICANAQIQAPRLNLEIEYADKSSSDAPAFC